VPSAHVAGFDHTHVHQGTERPAGSNKAMSASGLFGDIFTVMIIKALSIFNYIQY